MPFFPHAGGYDSSLAYAERQELFTPHALSLLWVDKLIKGQETGRSADESLAYYVREILEPVPS